jgi:DNA repair exonuclease SbcCD ATPase subunit
MANAAYQARKDIKVIANFVRGLMSLDEELDAIGSIEKMTKEADLRRMEAEKAAQEAAGRVEAVKAQIEDANRALAASKTEFEMARVAWESGRDVARREAKAIRDGATDEAKAIIAKAAAEADSLMRSAQSAAGKVDAERAAASSELARALDAIQEAVDRKKGIEAEIGRLRARFAPG